MIDLAITITTFSMMVMLFKYFDKLNVNNLIAITFNYFTAGTLALSSYLIENSFIELKTNTNLNLVITALVVGTLFVITFNLYAYSTQKIGITLSTISNKMSMVIPILIGIILFKEEVTFFKILGIFLAIGAILFSSKEDKRSKKLSQINIIILFLLFIGQGLADGLLNWGQRNILNSQNMNLFFTLTFLSAGFTGGLYSFLKIKTSNLNTDKKSIFWGIILGIPNYFSIFFVLRSLDSMESSLVFPILNIGVVILSALIGWGYYKEHLSKLNWLGVVLAISAIYILIYA